MIEQWASFVLSPAVGWMIGAVLLIEGAVLVYLWTAKGRGIAPLDLVPFLGAGLAFAAALTLALSDGGPPSPALAPPLGAALLIAGLFHIWDLIRRWR